MISGEDEQITSRFLALRLRVALIETASLVFLLSPVRSLNCCGKGELSGTALGSGLQSPPWWLDIFDTEPSPHSVLGSGSHQWGSESS